MLAVLGPPAVDRLDRAVVAPEREAEAVDRVALPDLRQQLGGVVGECRGTIERCVDLLEEAEFGHLVPRLEFWVSA